MLHIHKIGWISVKKKKKIGGVCVGFRKKFCVRNEK